MSMWNPWRGCRKCSDGCFHCYIHKGDMKLGVNTNEIVKTKDFKKPVERLKNGNYKMKSGIVYTCFSTDFLIEDADQWRAECLGSLGKMPVKTPNLDKLASEGVLFTNAYTPTPVCEKESIQYSAHHSTQMVLIHLFSPP